MGIAGRIVASVSRAIGGEVSRPTPKSLFMKGEGNAFFRGWNPVLRDARDDVRIAWAPATARAVDAIHNSGWLAGAIDQAVASTVGPGLKLNSKPDAAALGWTPEEAQSWARSVERRWEAWSTSPVECDVTGRMSVGQITAAALKTWFATGEIVATLPWIERPIAVTRTKIGLVQPHRLAQTTRGPDLYQGVYLDRNGMPVGYRFREWATTTVAGLYPYRNNAYEIDTPARDRTGRPLVIHVFDGAPGQVRGITPLTPALKVMRQYDQLADATLTAAMIQAIFAATVESAAPTEQILQALRDDGEQAVARDPSLLDFLSARSAFYDGAKIDIGNAGKITHLFPNETLKFNRSEHPNSTYEAFAKFLLREVARCLGFTFEDFTGDYSAASYASINSATSIVWRVVEYRRSHILVPFIAPIFAAWLEEEIDAGRIPFPDGLGGFLAHRAAACRAEWRGPGKPQADLLKTAKALETLLGSGVVSRSAVCAELGTDYDDVAEELASERDKRASLDLPEPVVAPGKIEAETLDDTKDAA